MPGAALPASPSAHVHPLRVRKSLVYTFRRMDRFFFRIFCSHRANKIQRAQHLKQPVAFCAANSARGPDEAADPARADGCSGGGDGGRELDAARFAESS